MKRYQFSRRAWLFGAASIVVSATSQAHAQMTVIDPTNLAQNVVQAARALEQINNQIRQIEQQAQMLARSPLQLSGELGQSLEQARALFDAARGVAFEAEEVGASLRELYPETFEAFELDAVLQRSDTWLEASRDSLELAMRAEAGAVASVRDARGRIDAALGASAGAEGQTGAAQAGNQLLGVTATQLAEIQTLLAAQGRALATERMERIAREQRASEIRRRAFPAARRTTQPARSAF
jgi:P-type conjugative transfer protein TrbJ